VVENFLTEFPRSQNLRSIGKLWSEFVYSIAIDGVIVVINADLSYLADVFASPQLENLQLAWNSESRLLESMGDIARGPPKQNLVSFSIHENSYLTPALVRLLLLSTGQKSEYAMADQAYLVFTNHWQHQCQTIRLLPRDLPHLYKD
jgi:hypothetical protein